ncbi:MAG: hypothetical protein LLG13_11070 [Bacteroidales bacterium]|nr:hypothetical protein [Bacteroidales bacterium]
MKINYIYKIKYEPRTDYEFKAHNKLVNTTTYEAIIDKQIPLVIESLNKNKGSRQGVIVVNNGISHNSCLINLQYQVYSSTLYVSANFRSQSQVYGRPSDTILICHVTNQIIDKLKYEIKDVDINVCVANYHHCDPEDFV